MQDEREKARACGGIEDRLGIN